MKYNVMPKKVINTQSTSLLNYFTVPALEAITICRGVCTGEILQDGDLLRVPPQPCTQ